MHGLSSANKERENICINIHICIHMYMLCFCVYAVYSVTCVLQSDIFRVHYKYRLSQTKAFWSFTNDDSFLRSVSSPLERSYKCIYNIFPNLFWKKSCMIYKPLSRVSTNSENRKNSGKFLEISETQGNINSYMGCFFLNCALFDVVCQKFFLIYDLFLLLWKNNISWWLNT